MGYTAFNGIEDILRGRIQKIDIRSFRNTMIGSCSALFYQCWGMCCSLKLTITRLEAETLTRLIREKKHFFKKMKLKIPENITGFDKKNNRFFLRKCYRGFLQLSRIINLLLDPGNKKYCFNLKLFRDFSYTCVFSMPDGRCGLQVLAESEKKHPWYYKPINCWKYPLSVNADNTLTVFRKEGNPVFTCNKTSDEFLPAYKTLEEEIIFLGKLIGRDILKEIRRS